MRRAAPKTAAHPPTPAASGAARGPLAKRYPKAGRAVRYAKPEGRRFADFLVAKVAQEVWIHLPWDLARPPAAPIGGGA